MSKKARSIERISVFSLQNRSISLNLGEKKSTYLTYLTLIWKGFFYFFHSREEKGWLGFTSFSHAGALSKLVPDICKKTKIPKARWQNCLPSLVKNALDATTNWEGNGYSFSPNFFRWGAKEKNWNLGCPTLQVKKGSHCYLI